MAGASLCRSMGTTGSTPAIAPTPPEPKPPEPKLRPPGQRRQLHPLPKGLVELYGLLAVLFVLVPEWMAGSALVSFRDNRRGSELPVTSMAWRRLPELRLAALSLAELRLLGAQLRICGYGRLNRERLTARLLKRIKRQQRQPLRGS